MAKPLSDIDILTLFPWAFTLVTSLLFLMPSFLMLRIHLDPMTAYWDNSYIWTAIVIPVIIFVAHVANVSTGSPNKFAVIVGLTGPCFILLFLSNSENVNATAKVTTLMSTDCDTFPMKRKLQQSWEDANSVYSKCLNDTASKGGLSVSDLERDFRIQDCEEYPAALDRHRKDWTYLRYLEEQQDSSGWCETGRQIWSKGPAKDCGSVVVASFFKNRVVAHTSEVFIIMLAVLLLTISVVLSIGPTLRHRMDW